MSDIIDRMVEAFDTEWCKWSCTADKPGMQETGFTVRRNDKIVAQGNFYETHEALDRLANRAAMIAAGRLLLAPFAEVEFEVAEEAECPGSDGC